MLVVGFRFSAVHVHACDRQTASIDKINNVTWHSGNIWLANISQLQPFNIYLKPRLNTYSRISERVCGNDLVSCADVERVPSSRQITHQQPHLLSPTSPKTSSSSSSVYMTSSSATSAAAVTEARRSSHRTTRFDDQLNDDTPAVSSLTPHQRQ